MACKALILSIMLNLAVHWIAISAQDCLLLVQLVSKHIKINRRLTTSELVILMHMKKRRRWATRLVRMLKAMVLLQLVWTIRSLMMEVARSNLEANISYAWWVCKITNITLRADPYSARTSMMMKSLELHRLGACQQNLTQLNTRSSSMTPLLCFKRDTSTKKSNIRVER